jgi:hypothetical protein
MAPPHMLGFVGLEQEGCIRDLVRFVSNIFSVSAVQ